MFYIEFIYMYIIDDMKTHLEGKCKNRS